MFVQFLLLRPPPLGIIQLDHRLPGLGRDAAGSEERTRFLSFLHKNVTFKLLPSQEERFLGVQVLLLVARRRLLRPAAGAAAVVGRP